MNIREVASEIDALAEELTRVRLPSRRDPDAFHEQMSDLKHRAEGIASWLRTGRKPIDLER